MLLFILPPRFNEINPDFKDELKNHITLVNLLKIGILILGFSPGLRDLLRVTMGV